MRINKIELGNFRLFENAVFEFPTLFTVIIGENGKGKSTILQGLRVASASFLLGIDEAERFHIQKEDVRRIDVGTRFATQRNCFVRAEGIVNESNLTWKRTLSREGGKTDTKNAKPIIQLAQNLNDSVNLRLERNISFPVISFFSTARLWAESKQTIKLKKKGSKLKDGYARCIDDRTDKLSPMEWIKTAYWKKLKEKEESLLLDAVFEAVDLCIPNWQPTEWDEDTDDLAGIYTDENGTSSYRPLFFLSDGLRTMAAMVIDIAYRCVTLNEHLGNMAIKESTGIVMIDEIDMHLHPKWQRNVVADLKKAFPKIQFIATTHSPFIVQSLQTTELINLDSIIDTNPTQLGIEDVSTLIMNVSPKASIYEKLYETASSYFNILNNAEERNDDALQSIKNQLDEIIAQHQDEPAFAAFLKLNKLAKFGN